MPNPSLPSRYVSDLGETLIVWEHEGVKALVDPCDQDVLVVVPVGRRANLIRFAFSGFGCDRDRDAHVIVVSGDAGLAFADLRHPAVRVHLRDLPVGQHVDVLPQNEPVAAYAVLPRPVPVLRGAVAVQPVYAYAAQQAA